MIKTNKLNKELAVLFFLVACYIFFIAYFRFTHQDVGWYYSYADRLATNLSLNGSHSTWSYVDANGNNGAGIIFMLVQLLAIIIGPNDLVAIKVLTGTIAFVTYLSFYFLLKKRLAVSHYFLFSLLLVIDPLFTFQIMNRPELLAGCLCLLIFNIGLNKDCKPSGFFLISFLTLLMLDIHPTALFAVLGFNVILFLRNYKKMIYFVGGALGGIAVTAGLNYVFNGTLGILAFFGNSTEYMADHYFPVVNDSLAVIIKRPFFRLKYFIVYFLFGVLLYYLAVHFHKLAERFRNNAAYKLLGLNAVIYFFISNLFSEGGNGYHLYSLFVYLPVFTILYSEILTLSKGIARQLFIIALFSIPAIAVYKNVPRIGKWVKNNSYFWSNYNSINEHVKDGDKLLVRPTFSFALSGRRVVSEPVFPMLMYMYINQTDFPSAILKKGYDIIVIDEMFLNDADIKSGVDIYSNGPYQKSVQQVKFDTAIIAEMARKGILVPVWNFNDFYHGHTILYRVDKNLLEKYCAEN